MSATTITSIGAAAALNGLGVPGISEVVLPLSGVSIRQGHLPALPLVIVVMLLQMVGLSLAFMIARFGGVELLERYGKYVLITRRELDHAQGVFNRRGTLMIAVGGFVPGLQGFIGYIGGLAEMRFRRFLIAAFAGKLVWNIGLLALGYALADQIGLIEQVLHQIGIAIVLLAIIAGIWWYLRRRRQVGA